MRIVSLNSWKNDGDYGRRLPLMRDGLAAMGADVICLQECFSGDGLDTAEWLGGELGLVAHAAPARRKVRLHDGRSVESASGLAILTRRPGEAAVLALDRHPADGERIAQRLDIVIDGRPLRVLNLHLTHLRDAAELRGMQLAKALAWAQDSLDGGLVVAGDLNATAEDPALAPLGLQARRGTLQGARVGAATSRLAAIDHCVLHRPGPWREGAEIRGCETPDVEGWFPSDHAAVGMDLI